MELGGRVAFTYCGQALRSTPGSFRTRPGTGASTVPIRFSHSCRDCRMVAGYETLTLLGSATPYRTPAAGRSPNMPASNPDVLAAVERALREDPTLSSTELQEQASDVDKEVATLTGRQFHARYALQAKKRIAEGQKPAPKGRARKAAGKPLDKSDPVRAVLRQQFEERLGALEEALDDAFRRSIEADSLTRVNRLLASMDEQVRNLRKV